jgi:hypothetical protein
MTTQIDDAPVDDQVKDDDDLGAQDDADKDKKDPPKADDKKDPFAALRGRDLSADEAAELLAKLTAANGEAASYRHKIKDFEKAAESDGERTVRESKEAGYTEAVEKFEPLLVKAAALPALSEAGATTGFDSLIRLFEKDKIVVNDDGSVDGVEAEVKRLKKEFPGMFPGGEPAKPTRKTAYGSRADGGDKSKGGVAPKSAAQRHADRVLGRSAD